LNKLARMSVVVDLGQVQGGSTNEDGPAPLCLQISSDGGVQPLADAVSPGMDVLPCSVEAIPAEPVSMREEEEEAECVTAATVDAEWGNEDDCDEVNEALTCLQIFTSADLALEIDEKTALASHAPNESDAHSSMPPAAQSEQAVCQLQQAPDPESKLHDTSLTLEQQIEEFEKQIATMEGLPASNDSVHSTYAELHSPAPHELVHKMRLAMKDIPEVGRKRNNSLLSYH
jgi:hypothetical protein